MEDYRALNRASWDERAPAHAASRDYAITQFVADVTFLSWVVRFDLPRLGEVAGLLRPGGRLFLREGHPMLWALEDAREDGLLVVAYPYFEREEPIVWDEGGTYVETDVIFQHNVTHEWNHGLGEIVTALLTAG